VQQETKVLEWEEDGLGGEEEQRFVWSEQLRAAIYGGQSSHYVQENGQWT